MSDCDAPQIAVNAAYPQSENGLKGMLGAEGTTIEHARMLRDGRIQSAIWALNEARRVRSDPQLMAEIRDWVAEKRHEFMLILDELGG